jgi:hypothetical protein
MPEQQNNNPSPLNPLKSKTHSIALAFLNGNDYSWRNSLQEVIEETMPSKIDFNMDTTHDSVISDFRAFVDDELLQYIEENMYDILSEREVFNEQDWENKSAQFNQAVKIFIDSKEDEIASNILSRMSEDKEYARNPAGYFGLNGDFDF